MVLVGSRKDSETYVRNKKKACEEVGIESFGTTLPEDVTEEEVLKVQKACNVCFTMHLLFSVASGSEVADMLGCYKKQLLLLYLHHRWPQC